MIVISQFLSLIGLCLNIWGVLLLSHDIIMRPGRDSKLDSLKRNMENRRIWTEGMIKTYRSFPKPPYTDEMINEIIQEKIISYKEFWDKVVDEEKELLEKSFELTGYMWAKRGLMWVLFGFIFQLGGHIVNWIYVL